MPRYFFHVRDGDRIIRDEDGLDLPNIAVATAEAKAGAIDLLSDAQFTGNGIAHQVMEVTDSEGRVLAKVELRTLIH